MGLIFNKADGLNDSIYGKSQEPIRAIIEKGVEAFEQNSQVANIFSMDTTKNFAEKYTSETSLGDFEDVGEGGTYTRQTMQEGWSKVIEPLTWKSSFEVTQEMIEDAKHGKIKSRANMFTLSYGRTREKYAAALINGGIATSTTIGTKSYSTATGDGKALFAIDHKSKTNPDVAKYKQGNKFKWTSGTLTAALDAAQEKMQMFKDDDLNLLNVCPDTIIIPNKGALKREVFAAVGSELDPNTGNNAFNFQMGLWNVIVWPYLDLTMGGGDYFLLMDSKFKDAYECLPFLDRIPLTVKSTIDDETDNNVFRGRARFGAGFNNWRCISVIGKGFTDSGIAEV